MSPRTLLPVLCLLGALTSAPAAAQDASTLSTYSLYVYAGVKVLSTTGGGICAAVVLNQKGGSGPARQLLMSSTQVTQVFVCLAISTPEAALLAMTFDDDEQATQARSPDDPKLLEIVRAGILERRRELATEVAMGAGPSLEELVSLLEYASMWRVSRMRFRRCVRQKSAALLPGFATTDNDDPAVRESARLVIACAHGARVR